MKFDRPTLVTLTAPTCSGKSYLLNELTERGHFSRIVSTTTRPARPGEREGIDYDYISMQQSKEMEERGEFFELIEFNGIRYGVTHTQMQRAMAQEKSPIVVLEPKGLEIYEQKCRENGWQMFKIYVNTVESKQLERLLQRTVTTAALSLDLMRGTLTNSPHAKAFQDVAFENAKRQMEKVVTEHQKRLLSITGDERHWQTRFSWDAIVSGEDTERAIKDIQVGVNWRNRKNSPPRAIGAVKLPL